jgi:hypothetical protein
MFTFDWKTHASVWRRGVRTALLLLLLAIGCQERSTVLAHEAPSPPDVRSPMPSHPTGQRTVTARVVRLLGIAWAHVLVVELDGALRGSATLYLPAGDKAARSCALDETGKPKPMLSLQLSPLAAPEAGSAGPFVFHLQQQGDGGRSYWAVNACEAVPASTP